MSFQDVLSFAKEYPAVLGLSTFLIGLYIGNRQAIGRDRRKEFNEVSQDAFIVLNKQIEQIKKYGQPGESVADFLLFYNYVPLYKRWLFQRHVERYKSAQQGLIAYHVENGTVTFNHQKINQLYFSARALLRYLARR